jgi:hypothetical protein
MDDFYSDEKFGEYGEQFDEDLEASPFMDESEEELELIAVHSEQRDRLERESYDH